MEKIFNHEDLAQIAAHGLTESEVDDQLRRFQHGFPRTHVTSAVRADGSIRQLNEETIDQYIDRYQQFQGSRIKFVPASGAATRMLKKLYQYLDNPIPDDNPFEGSLELYPFRRQLIQALRQEGSETIDALAAQGRYDTIISVLLSPDGLNFADSPKALIPFHKIDPTRSRTAIEEHFVEGALYAKDHRGEVRLLFTVSPQYLERIQQFVAEKKGEYEKEFKVKYKIDYSIQDPKTDTIAVKPNFDPYRDENGRLVFRPAGHGALLHNLQDIDEELIFIKNIDNVAPDHLKTETIRYKQTLAGLLLKVRDQIYHMLESLEDKEISEAEVNAMLDFCRSDLAMRMPMGVKEASKDRKMAYLRMKLDRPLRVCGVVRNEGEPGGGPFWVRERDGSETLQIVESSQMDLEDPRVMEIFQHSRYFNPVDLVCSIRDYKGNKYDLRKFVNKNTGFIAHKSINGEDVLTLELPGLWNGAMANWNSIFVEVPAITFTPVKEITDLIRPEHQE